MRLSIIIGSVAVLLLTAVILFACLFKGKESPETERTTPEIFEGEAIYRGQTVAYPALDASTITRITVNNVSEGGINEFTFVKDELSDGDFLFTYVEDGEVKIFYPSIMGATGIEYSDFYAIDTDNGYNAITRLNYLTSSLQHSYFGQRIALSDNPTEREEQLEDYGFGEGKESVVVFEYTDTATARPMSHKIVIGGKTVTGSGYYFTVDNRDFIYSSSSQYFSYALLGFYSYVNTTLIAEGLTSDSTYEPIITSDFTHWKNTLHIDSDKNGVCDIKDCALCGSDPMSVKGSSTVVISAAALTPISPDDYSADPSAYGKNTDGYESIKFEDMSVELYTGVDKNKTKKSLIGKELGEYADALVYTLPVSFNTSREIDFSSSESVKYSYSIVEIEAVVTDAEDKLASDTVISNTDTVRVAYRFTVNGKTVTPLLSHAVLDLTSSALPWAVADKIAAQGIGKLDTPIDFDIIYTKENSIETDYKTVVTEIVSVTDKDGAAMSKITEDSETVVFRYAFLIDGELSGTEYLTQVTMSELDTENEIIIKNLFMGNAVSDGLSLVMSDGKAYGEIFTYFNGYIVENIQYFTTREEIVSFSYINYSERDPFFGESIYRNNTDGYTLYGINNDYCDRVLRLVGGLGESSNQSTGLKGEEIVSVGITPEKLMQHGCYAHTLYFELPRGISVVSSENPDVPADYIAAETLPFTLYISEIKDDGTRIVASTLYDVIVKVSNEYLFFLDETFVGFWARENVIMTGVNTLKQINIELMMDDIKGSYQLNVAHDTAYRTPDGFQIGGVEPDEYIDSTDYVTVNVIPGENCTPNKLTELCDSVGKGYVSLEDLYEYTIADEKKLNEYLPDSFGTTYFKEFMLGLYYIGQEGFVSKEEQDKIMSEREMVMKFSLKIDTGNGNYGYYTYEFYHFGDANKVLVSLYKTDADGEILTPGSEVSDFYISRLAYKRMVYTFTALLNGEEFELGEEYPEFK